MSERTTTMPGSRKSEAMSGCTTVAVDLAKQVFQVAGENRRGEVVYEVRLRSRQAFSRFIDVLPVGITVLLETGPGAQAWARQVQAAGNQVRILPAQRAAEHRSGAKNDRKDALALLRAGRDRQIREVPVKTVQALAIQAVHRVRRGYVRRRTAVGNQIRGLLLEHGIAIAQGGPALARRASGVVEDASQPVPDLLRELVADLLAEWHHLDHRVGLLKAELERLADQDPACRRLKTVRGIGPVIATALVAKQLTPEHFASGRQFAAYFGLVPEQHSSGNRIRLGAMSKRGDGYLRSLMVEGAQAVLRQLRADSSAPDDRRLQRWLQRHGRKGAAVRLANRNLRIAWVLLKCEQAVYCRQPGEVAMNT